MARKVEQAIDAYEGKVVAEVKLDDDDQPTLLWIIDNEDGDTMLFVGEQIDQLAEFLNRVRNGSEVSA